MVRNSGSRTGSKVGLAVRKVVPSVNMELSSATVLLEALIKDGGLSKRAHAIEA